MGGNPAVLQCGPSLESLGASEIKAFAKLRSLGGLGRALQPTPPTYPRAASPLQTLQALQTLQTRLCRLCRPDPAARASPAGRAAAMPQCRTVRLAGRRYLAGGARPAAGRLLRDDPLPRAGRAERCARPDGAAGQRRGRRRLPGRACVPWHYPVLAQGRRGVEVGRPRRAVIGLAVKFVCSNSPDVTCFPPRGD